MLTGMHARLNALSKAIDPSFHFTFSPLALSCSSFMYLPLKAVPPPSWPKTSSIIFQQHLCFATCSREHPASSSWPNASPQCTSSHISQLVWLSLVTSYRAHSILWSLDRDAFIKGDESGYHTVPVLATGPHVYVLFKAACSTALMLETIA